MNHPRLTIMRILGRKLTAFMLIAVSAAAAFATLGDGKKRNASTTPKNALLSGRTAVSIGYFTLKSGYTYKGSEVLNSSADKKYISLNTVVNLQRGNTNYVIPLKKKAILDKVKIEFGNRQLKRN